MKTKDLQVFTPRLGRTKRRLNMRIAPCHVPRGKWWQRIVTDDKGACWLARGVPCDLEGCFCDVSVRKLKPYEYKLVELFYVDGSNYKCLWVAAVDNETLKKNNIKAGQEERKISDLGLDIRDIPLIREYGLTDDDSLLVDILSICKPYAKKDR